MCKKESCGLSHHARWWSQPRLLVYFYVSVYICIDTYGHICIYTYVDIHTCRYTHMIIHLCVHSLHHIYIYIIHTQYIYYTHLFVRTHTRTVIVSIYLKHAILRGPCYPRFASLEMLWKLHISKMMDVCCFWLEWKRQLT
jgi:hypothetical protein